MSLLGSFGDYESPLAKLVAERGVTISSKYIGRSDDPMWRGSDKWNSTLRYQGRRLTVPFHMGPGLGGREPSAADALSALVSDTTGYENARSFEEWAGDLGFDSDDPSKEREARKVYRAVERQAPKVRAFLGDDFDLFAAAEH